jgi:hypothetical protein
MASALSLPRLANEKVPFWRAAAWAEIGPPSERGTKNDCLECGEYASMRVWYTHAWCFACKTRFSAVRVLATVWDVDPETAAIRALKEIGYSSASYEELWQAATPSQVPDRGVLGRALVSWCAATIPGWDEAQYRPEVADLLSGCLALLVVVYTEEDCEEWMAGCQQVMGRFAPSP